MRLHEKFPIRALMKLLFNLGVLSAFQIIIKWNHSINSFVEKLSDEIS